jgi:hypothetical protein
MAVRIFKSRVVDEQSFNQLADSLAWPPITSEEEDNMRFEETESHTDTEED